LKNPVDVLHEAKELSGRLNGSWVEPQASRPMIVVFYSKSGFEIAKFAFASDRSLSDQEAAIFLNKIRDKSPL
jgi:hypothetical protein